MSDLQILSFYLLGLAWLFALLGISSALIRIYRVLITIRKAMEDQPDG